MTPEPEYFSLREAAAGVWQAEADLSGIAIGNAAIIDAGAGKTIVVDTFMSDIAAAELKSVAERLTGNRVFLVVNTHWHADHTYGNQEFAGIPVVATRRIAELMALDVPGDAGAWEAEVDAAIVQLEAQAEDDPETARRLASQRVFRGLARRFQLTLPDLLIDHRLVIEGERRVEIRTEGRGHTVSDVFVWLPDDGVLVTGDLAWNGIHPRMHDGFPRTWAEYVGTLIGLSPKRVIPGHGPADGPEILSVFPEYFREVADMVDAVRSGTSPSELEPPAVGADWAGVQRFRSGLEALAARPVD